MDQIFDDDKQSIEISQPSCDYEIENMIDFPATTNHISYTSLIKWNITKALQKNPQMNLKETLKIMQEKLENNSLDGGANLHNDDRYLTCALLAWKNLGENDTNRLYEFISKNINLDPQPNAQETSLKSRGMSYENYNISSMKKSFSEVGPVVKIPIHSTIVMRVDAPGSGGGCSNNKAKLTSNRATQKRSVSGLKEKIDESCCGETTCTDKLSNLDQSTGALKRRAAQLAKREAERAELLERAEGAWRDLETGYQRRLKLAEEKEATMRKQIEKLLEERTKYKDACPQIAVELRRRGEEAEAQRKKLALLEKELLERACVRHHFAEDAAKGDSSLADQQCKAAQLDRDLLFKEEQAERRVQMLSNQIESAQILSHESERAMRTDMAALKEHTKEISKQLLDEDANINEMKTELAELKRVKDMMLKDMDGCQLTCDDKMAKGMDELRNKKNELIKLKERVLECKCKLPIDQSIQVKRTPSLAALCLCLPDDRICHQCSCTSLRTNIMTNLFADLFSGLQSELGKEIIMPCQLLKCLEDRHNWDQATAVKARLREFFSKLLISELDIAIATSIEKYHARWVGTSCADTERAMMEKYEADKVFSAAQERLRERDIEMRARQMATTLADQLFEQKAEALAATRAKEILKSGPPPCECARNYSDNNAEVYPCTVQRTPNLNRKNASTGRNTDILTSYWVKTHKDVSLLRTEIEDLKKDSIKKDDLKSMEKKLTKIVQKATNLDKACCPTMSPMIIEDAYNYDHNVPVRDVDAKVNTRKMGAKIKTPANVNKPKLSVQQRNTTRGNNRVAQTFAVNVCLCGTDKSKLRNEGTKGAKMSKNMSLNNTAKSWKCDTSPSLQEGSSLKQSKPIRLPSHEQGIKTSDGSNQVMLSDNCKRDCICFNKEPSNTSLKKLVSNLMKWQSDYSELQNLFEKNTSCSPNLSTSLGSKSPIRILENNRTNSVKESPDTTNNGLDSPTKLDVPKATESEYLGAVNLEKSSESNKKYVVEIDNNTTNTEFSNMKSLTPNKSIRFEESIKKLNNNDKEIYTKQSNLNDVIYKKVKDLRSNLPPQCDYNVKFLGVTLVDGASLAQSTENYKNSLNKDTVIKNIDKKSLSMVMNNILHKNVDIHDSYNAPVTISSKLKDDDNSIKNSDLCPINTCVCCKGMTNDLEVNTFELLQEHFSNKLREFQSTCCKSTCIKPNDEQILLSSMFDKVKTVISENIKTIICKCPHEKQLDNSWNRAYSLLQEYLKMKMKRAQCFCDISIPTKDKFNDNLHQQMLTNICNLIENDFNRIKRLCKCNDGNASNYMIFSPENATCFVKNVIKDETIKETLKQNIGAFNSIIIDSQNETHDDIISKCDVGAQLSLQYFTKNKSCNGIANESVDTQTMYNIDQSYFMLNECECSHKKNMIVPRNEVLISCCQNLTKCNTNEVFTNTIFNRPSRPISIENNEILNIINGTNAEKKKIEENEIEDASVNKVNICNNEIKESLSKVDVDKNLPYIGCTLHCSCANGFGGSVCRKQFIDDNNEQLKSLYDSFLQNKATNENYYKKMIEETYTSPPQVTTIKETDQIEVSSKIEQENKSKNDNISFSCETADVDECEDLVLKNSANIILLKESAIMNTEVKYDITSISPNKSIQESSYKHDVAVINTHSSINCNASGSGNAILFPIKTVSRTKLSEPVFGSIDFNDAGAVGSDNCECKKVPLCHVKMLVENIENTLLHKKCTCNFSPKICPIHSYEEETI